MSVIPPILFDERRGAPRDILIYSTDIGFLPQESETGATDWGESDLEEVDDEEVEDEASDN